MTQSENKARQYFGVTDNPSLAGFILTNGEMLNFSECGFQRDYDHIEIGYLLMDCMEDARVESENTAAVDNFAIDELFKFMAEGPIRSGENWLELIAFPTPEQNNSIVKFCDSFFGHVAVWIADGSGEVVEKMSFERETDSWEIVEWIRSTMLTNCSA